MPFVIGRKFSLFAAWFLLMGLVAGCAAIPGSPAAAPTSVDRLSAFPSDAEHQKTDALPLFLVPDLDAVIQTDEHRRIFTRYFAVPSVPEITRAQSEYVTGIVEAFKTANLPGAERDEPPTAELNIRSHLTAVSTKAVGIRINTFESAPAGGQTRYKTQWFDPNGTGVLGSRDLFGSGDDWTEFKEFVTQSSSVDARVLAGSMLDLDDSWLDSVNFDFSGNALVEFDDDALGPGSAGPLVVKVNAENIAPLLSPFGSLARNASTSPSPRVQLGMLQDAATQSHDGASARDAGEEADDAKAGPRASPPRSIDCTKTKCVALTFDDGPGPGTGKLLDTLEEGEAPSTFFVTGPNAKLRPEILKRMVTEGHEIGNHTWNHRALTALSSSQIQGEIDRTNAVITKAVNQPATLLRPPYGARSSITDRFASTPVVLWDVDTLDWKHRNTKKVIDSAVNQSTPGSIVLMHDIHSSTIAAVPGILDGLRAKGYTFVTVSELLGSTGLEAGRSYSHAPHRAAKTGTGDDRAPR